MKKNLHWETIVSIIILVIIISIALISMIKIIEYDNNLNFEYDKINYISLLEKNTNILIQKIDTSLFQEGDILFLYKTGNTITAFSGSENENYKYTNYLWEYVSTETYKWAIYTRQCLIENKSEEWQMIKCDLKELKK